MNRFQLKLDLTVDVTAFDAEDAAEAALEWFTGEVHGNPDLFVSDADVYRQEQLP